MKNATDLIAKLLANEDITVVQSSVPTASFNIQSRVLTLPIWKDATDDLIGMLVGHEVGHALYTTKEYYENEFIDTEYERAYQGYLNVLEDVRIEKLMKRKYPGIRKTFLLGYKELNDKDFFETKGKDFNDMLLIDKINLYFKAGYNCGVTFNKEQKSFVDRAERTETIQEVMQLAKEIFAYTKDELEKAMEEAKAQQEAEGTLNVVLVKEDEDEEGEEYDEDSSVQSIGANASETLEELLEAKTETAYQKKINELADTSTEYVYLKPGKFLFDPFVSYKQVMHHIKDRRQYYLNNGYEQFVMTETKQKSVNDLKSSSGPVVNYLIKEFEMKKAATAYKRTTVAKTGQLDMRKIYAYKLQDDLFKRMSVVKNGKNHGMVFLLDWSGSMTNCIQQTLDQVINLAMFCRSAQIPFQVLAFTNGFKTQSYKENYAKITNGQEPLLVDVNDGPLGLLEFFNHKMTTSEFNEMITLVKLFGTGVYPLNGTPLNQSLNYMIDHIAKFKKQYNVEKLTFITLTDGQGEGMRPTYEPRHEYNKTYKHFLLDEVTGKSYPINKYRPEEYTNAYLSIIKERYDATTLGFYLTTTSWHSMHSVLTSHYSEPTNIAFTIERMKKEIKERGYASLKGTGRDELFVVPLQSKIQDGSIEDIKSTGTSASIAKQFGKLLNKRKTSRVLLSKFIDYVA